MYLSHVKSENVIRATRATVSTVAAMVAVPPEEGATPSLVTVSGSTVAVKISVMKLREPNMLVTMRHDQTLQNAITRSGLSNVVNDGKPPSRGAVIKANPLANNDVIDDLEYDAMEQYQEENAKLFDLVYDSINFSSEWEILDAEHVRTSFIKGAVSATSRSMVDGPWRARALKRGPTARVRRATRTRFFSGGRLP